VSSETALKPVDEPLSVSDVPPHMAGQVWPHVEPHVMRGLKHGQGDETTSHHMLAAVLQGHRSLWVIHKGTNILGCVVWKLNQYDTCKKIWVDIIAGKDMNEWYDMTTDLLLDYMDLVGAKCLEGSARPGMAKVMKKHGAKVKAIIMETTR